MKKQSQQQDADNLALKDELSSQGPSSLPELGPTIAEKIRLLIGSQSAAAFARKCGIGESLLSQYLAGSMPGADKLAKIAIANHVSLDWLGADRGPQRYDEKLQAAHEDRVAGTYLDDESAAQRADEYARRAIDEQIKLPTETVLRLAREEQVEPGVTWITLLVELLALGHITEVGARRILQHLKE